MPAVYELAGQLEDPLAEEIVATLFSDQPVRPVVRPTDNRRHWQWLVRDPEGQTSRVWVGYAQPITDDSVAELEDRAESSLAVFVPDFATSIEVTATQTAVDEISMVVSVVRPAQVDLTIQLLVQGGTGA
jgi:phage gp46-like protein